MSLTVPIAEWLVGHAWKQEVAGPAYMEAYIIILIFLLRSVVHI